MFGMSDLLASVVTSSIQVIAVISVIVSRLNTQCLRHQLFYFGVLFAVAGMMFATIATGSGHCIWFAISTAIMVVGATVDFSRGQTLQSTQFGA